MFEESSMLCGAVVDVEDVEGDVEVVEIVQLDVGKADDVQDEVVVAKLVENESHDGYVGSEMLGAGR